MLELDTSRRESYHENEAEKSPIVKAFLKSVWEGSFPKITSATIDGNDVYLELKQTDNCTIKSGSKGYKACPHSVINDATNLSPFHHTHSSENGRIKFYPDSSIKNIKAIFTTDKGFHSRTHDLFRTEKKTEGKYPNQVNKIVGMLEENGLEGAEHLEIKLAYTTPFAVWRGLPREFLDNVKGFNFKGIGWPIKKQYSFIGDDNELEVPYSKDRFEQIKEALKKTGLVEYNLKEGRTSFDDKHRFLVNPKEIKKYKNLQALEELARDIDLESKSWRSDVELLIEGNLSRDSFGLVHKIFDESESIETRGHVKGGDITVGYDRSNDSKNRINITLENATLEKTARLMKISALSYCSLKFGIETDEWRTINFCDDVGHIY